MKKFIAICFVAALMACNNPEKEASKIENDLQDTTLIKPTEKWDVHKEYDEFGNLIKYDSIYTWAYSNKNGDDLSVNLDSIMDTFKGYFGKNTPYEWREDFFYFPKKDSLFMHDFFKEDYFYRSWQDRHTELEAMIQRMDSARNSFLRQFHPGLMESNKKSNP